MKLVKPYFAFLRRLHAKHCPSKFHPQLEALEDRFQPSFPGVSLDSIEAHAVTGFHHMDFVAQRTLADQHRFSNMLTLNTATYITGTIGSATARGIALGQDGSTYETGTITTNGSEEGYVAKYDPNGKQVYLFTFQAVDDTAHPSITFMTTEGHALAVDGVGNVYVAGTAIDASSGNHNAYTLKISADGTAILWGIGLDGPGNPATGNITTGDGIAVNDPNNDGNGLAVVTGTLTIPAGQQSAGDHLYLVRWNADGTSEVSQDNRSYTYYTFGLSDLGSHGKSVALDTNSTVSTPGALAYIAGNILINGKQQILAVQVSNGSDPLGLPNWSVTLENASTIDSLTGVVVKPDDTCVFAGTVYLNPITEGFVWSLDVKGNSLFTTRHRAASSYNAIAVDSAGNLFTTGAAANPSRGGIYLAMLDNKGQLVSDLQFGDVGTVDAGYGIVATSSGTLWVVGDTTSSSLSTDGTMRNGTQDGFLASVIP
jgi:hypothetical protein